MDLAKRLKMEFADKQKIRNCREMAENFPSRKMFKYSHAQGFQNIILHREYAFYFCKYEQASWILLFLMESYFATNHVLKNNVSFAEIYVIDDVFHFD